MKATNDLEWDMPIVLVGLMGAGKSAIGRRLAQRLDLNFIDADTEIESKFGKTVSYIFEHYGEAEFRKQERCIIRQLLHRPPHVMASGGGAFIDPETRHLIRQNSLSIWLRAGLDVLHARVQSRDDRPLLRSGEPRSILAALIGERYPIYALADVVVDSIDGPHDEVVNKVVWAISNHRRLRGLPEGG